MFTSFARWIKNHDLLTYFVLAFLFTYTAWSVTLLIPAQVGPTSKANFAKIFQSLGMWGPALAGILTTAVTRGKPGLKDLFRRLLHWRVSLRWYLLILLLWPLITILADFLYAQITHQSVRFQWNGWSQTINWLDDALFTVFWASEEIGWRGFAMPRLLSRWNALVSSLIVGAVWGLWHLPLFFMGNIPPITYFIFTASVSILMTWIMNNNQGSLFLAVFFHAWINFYGGIHADRFIIAEPDPVRQTVIRSILMAAAALVVVALYGYRTFTRERKSSLLAEWKPGAP